MKKERVILKLSGEALAGDAGVGLSPLTVSNVAKEIKEAYDLGVELAIIVGGGNIWRGKTASELGMDRSSADYMGMLATVMNALALQNALEALDVPSRTMTSISMPSVAEPYIRRKAIRHLEKGRIVIFGGGTGNPFFSTDTTTSLRAAEIGADKIYMAKNGVDGVYDKDPKVYNDAKRFSKITHQEVLEKRLRIMDQTAAALCKDNQIKIIVFNMNEEGNIKKVIQNNSIGTIIED